MQGLSDIDLMEIDQLLVRFSHALDFGDTDTFVACFADDAYLDSSDPREGLGGVHRGREALRRFATAMLEHGGGQLRHSTLNLLIEGDGRTAKATSTLLVTQAFADATDPFGRPSDATRSILSETGMCFDEFAKATGGWRFSRRLIRNDATPDVMARVLAPVKIGPAP